MSADDDRARIAQRATEFLDWLGTMPAAGQEPGDLATLRRLVGQYPDQAETMLRQYRQGPVPGG